ncbi:MAG: ATP-binding protein [Marinilabiliaceae bacterium]|nr:ATP-binding protein [Marinilabiliaceae bacterium]
MQTFFNTHRYLLEHLDVPIHRELKDQIDWSHRLIGIKGARGVGKTTFLLDYAKSTYGLDRNCLYINLNNLYFTERSLISFADEFRKTGGKTLILDQVYKYPNWSEELRRCYDEFNDLQIVFSGSSVMRLKEENPELSGKVKAYQLNGFSFREYLNYKAGTNFHSVTLSDILSHHRDIAREIIDKVKPLAYFNDYLNHGYYPFFLEKRNFFENLVKTINLGLEIDISYLQQVELKYLPKLRKLLYLVGVSAPFQPNVSKLSSEIDTSRATVMNYLKYLRQGKLINLLYEGEEDPMKKPSMVYLHNPNLVFSVLHGDIDPGILHKTFFFNQVGYQHNVSASKNHDFLVNNEMAFCIDAKPNNGNDTDTIYARDMIEIGQDNEIPLWLFGFLY